VRKKYIKWRGLYKAVNKLDEYHYTIKSEETKKTYDEYLLYFERFSKKSPISLLKLAPKKIQELLIQYVMYMRDQKLSSSSIKGRLAPLFKLLDLNDAIVNKKRILMYAGEDKTTVKDEAYSKQDIEKMVSISKPRTRLIILLYSSTGMRRSALLDLKLKHLEKVEELGIYKITVYQNTKEQHIVFTTNETATAIDQYIQLRKEAGENITKDSWLIRNDFDVDNSYSAKNAKKTSPVNVNTLLRNVLIKTGLRSVNQPKNLRNEKATVHGFRKFTTTQFVNSGLNPEIREMLLGHKIGLAGVYYRPTQNTMLEEYMKAADNLTIDPTFRLNRRIKVLEGREKEIELMKIKHEEEIKDLRQQLASNMEIMARRMGEMDAVMEKYSKVKPNMVKFNLNQLKNKT